MKPRIGFRVFALALAAIALSSPTDGFSQGPGSLPFASTYRRPSTSRYQNIANFANNPLAASNVYQSLVQPAKELEKTRVEQMSIARRLGSTQDDVRSLQRKPAGLMDQTIRPTGHAAGFLNYSHFYPSSRY